jgi:hypothetical protein
MCSLLADKMPTLEEYGTNYYYSISSPAPGVGFVLVGQHEPTKLMLAEPRQHQP